VTAATVAVPTSDELVTTALAAVDRAQKRLDQPLTVARVHAIKQDLTVVKGMLLTRPLRPEEVTG